MRDLHFVSWNVAGWRTTLRLIKERYGGLARWLQQMNADFVCIQEAKIARARLGSDAAAVVGLDHGDDWEVFLSCCESATQASGGYSGVATYVRHGWTLDADCRPFQRRHLLLHFLRIPPIDCASSPFAGYCSRLQLPAEMDKAEATFQALRSAGKEHSKALDERIQSLLAELNGEGRTLVTHHKMFTLVNVYAPTSNRQKEYQRLVFKFYYHFALRCLLADIKAKTGKSIILCGDLNLSYRGQDVCREENHIPFDDIHDDFITGSLSQIQRGVFVASVPQIRSVLESLKIEERPHRNPRKPNVFRASIRPLRREANGGGRGEPADDDVLVCAQTAAPPAAGTTTRGTREETDFVQIGKPFDSSFQARLQLGLRSFNVALSDPVYTMDKDENARPSLIPEQQPPLPAWPPSVLPMRHLVDLVEKCQFPLRSTDIPRLTEEFGRASSSLISQIWMQKIVLELDRFHDSFVECWPEHSARFSCWEQATNARFSNSGVRIDYFLVDDDLVNASAPEMASEYRAKMIPTSDSAADTVTDCFLSASAEMAFRDAVGNGMWQPAPMDGSGLQPESDKSLAYCMQPHRTGMLYTAPRFSDHIPVTLLLRFEEAEADSLTMPATRLQSASSLAALPPRRNQASIKSFFSADTTSAAKRKREDCVDGELASEALSQHGKRGRVADSSSTEVASHDHREFQSIDQSQATLPTQVAAPARRPARPRPPRGQGNLSRWMQPKKPS